MQITVCDICKSQDDVGHTCFVTDRRLDEAGSMSDIFTGFDLCLKCHLKAISKALKDHFRSSTREELYSYNKRVIEIIRERMHKGE